MFSRPILSSALRRCFTPSLSSRASSSSSASTVLKLYGFPLSQPTRSVLMLLKENAVPYELVLVDALKGDHRKPDFLALNEAGLVPIIADSGFDSIDASGAHKPFILGESAAILQHLCETRGLHEWYPSASDPASATTRARINRWLHWHHQG